MSELGRLEDLPTTYRKQLSEQNLVPLWPSLRGVMPPTQPRANTVATMWAYQSIKPLLLQAGELTPIERAERRVLVLANPGHGLEKMQASPAIYLGMQLLLPAEWAPAHKHTPNAVRMIVEGEGAYTNVDGDKCPMSRGDLILTPTGHWHEHGHDGDKPVVWLDVLDLPLVYYMEASYHVNGAQQATAAVRGDKVYKQAGVVPTHDFVRSTKPYPLIRYPWAQVRESLVALGQEASAQESIMVTYVNPETGEDAQNILGFYALMLRPNQSLKLPVRSPASIFHVIEGSVRIAIAQEHFHLQEADTCCAPGYTTVTLENAHSERATFIFIADESPLHRKLGVYEVRAQG